MDTLARRLASIHRSRLAASPHLTQRARRGFTLIEVLVVVAIIALLLAVLLPSLSLAKEQAQRVGCLANLRSQGQAMMFYAEDHNQDYYMYNRRYSFTEGLWNGTGYPISDDSVVALALDMKSVGKPGDPGYNANTLTGAPSKKYFRDWNMVICPATHNKVRNALDLNYNADNRVSGPSDGKYGHSYEYWNGFQKNDFAGPGSVGTAKKLYSGSSSDTNNDGFPDCLKRPKIVAKRASLVILVVDGDDDPADDGRDERNNFPDDVYDNHGAKGWNMLFADAHAQWITPHQTYRTLDRSDMDVSDVPQAFWPKDDNPPPAP